MKIEIDARFLREALKKCAYITERCKTFPIISCIKIDGHHDEIVLTATDLDRVLIVHAQGVGSGSALINLQNLQDAVKHQSGMVSIEVKATKATGTCDRSVFTLPTFPLTDWPRFDHGTVTAGFKINAQELGWAFERCYSSISTDTGRSYLNGAFIHWGSWNGYTGLAIAATDGQQLTRAQLPELEPVGKSIRPEGIAGIVPRKAVSALVRLITPAQGDDRLEYTDELTVRQSGPCSIDIEAEGWRLSTKLLDGIFPDYCRIFQGIGRPDNRCTVDTAELVAAVARLAALKQGPVTLQIPGQGRINLIVEAEGMEATETLKAETVGKPCYAGVNLSYLAKAATMADGDDISFGLTDPSTPVLIDMPDHDGHLLHLIMPTRVAKIEAETAAEQAAWNVSQAPVKPVAPAPTKHKTPAKPRTTQARAAPADIKGEFTPVK